jgi:hypothetical protein
MLCAGEQHANRSADTRRKLTALDMASEGLLLYDRDGFLAHRLARVRARLGELGAVQRRIGDVTYWDLKPDFEPEEVITQPLTEKARYPARSGQAKGDVYRPSTGGPFPGIVRELAKFFRAVYPMFRQAVGL